MPAQDVCGSCRCSETVLQLLANDESLEPRDILVMTPQVEAFAPW